MFLSHITESQQTKAAKASAPCPHTNGVHTPAL